MLLSSFQMQVSAQLSVGHCWYQGREEWGSDMSFVAAGPYWHYAPPPPTSLCLVLPLCCQMGVEVQLSAGLCWHYPGEGTRAPLGRVEDERQFLTQPLTPLGRHQSPAYFHQAVGRKSAPCSLDTTGQEDWCTIASFRGADRSGLRWEIHFLLRDKSYSRITKSKSLGIGHQPWYFQQAFQFILIHSEGESRESTWLLRSPRMITGAKIRNE